MPVLDHVYVFCQPGAPEQQRLLAAGLRVGRARIHVGQGTANVCFFFADLMLELIWLRDRAEAQAAGIAMLRLDERADWRRRGTSPFGIAVRSDDADDALPGATEPYAAPYLPSGITMPIAVNPAGAREPMLFGMPPGVRWDPPAVDHPLRHAKLHRAAFAVPGLAAGSPLRQVALPALQVAQGAEHRLELDLAAGPTRTLDLAPELPLVLRW